MGQKNLEAYRAVDLLLGKLHVPDVHNAFQHVVGGRFSMLIIRRE